MMFKLDLKKITLTAFIPTVQNRLMQEVNILCTENDHLYAFYEPTKIVQMDEGFVLIFVSGKKIAHYFWRRVYVL